MAGFVLALLFAAVPARATDLGNIVDRLSPNDAFPGANTLVMRDGPLPVADAFANERLVGHVYLTSDLVDATGYSGKPIKVLVGLDPGGVIRAARLIEHHEPIVLIGIPEARVKRVIDSYIGMNVLAEARATASDRGVDIVSGATVTIMVVDDSIVRAGLKVARALGLGGLTPGISKPARRIDSSKDARRDWHALVADGSVKRLKVDVRDVNAAFIAAGDPLAIARPEPGAPDDTFIEVNAAVVSVAGIGRSLLGDAEYANLQRSLAPDEHAILLAGRGRYSYKGSGYVRGGIFDRFHIVQGEQSFRFRDQHHKRLRRVDAVGAPAFTEVDLFRTVGAAPFDPAAPWRMELLIGRPTGARSKAFTTFVLDHAMPERYLLAEDKPVVVQTAAGDVDGAQDLPAVPLWQTMWRAKQTEIAILAVALAVLTLIFFFQNSLARRPALTQKVRIAFLLFTVLFIGWYANAQLSVVNVLTVFSALVNGFDWSYFLMDPLVFMLWGAVATGLVFWGRGAFCGWLCPFGALQELTNRAARALGVRQVRVPWAAHERLWAVKYLLFLILFGVSLHSLALAEHLAEVEPFKTAVILKFDREWGFVTFAVALLLVGLFIERFYCRYLCALGAALAIPARMRTFEWLKRYRQCGNPCQRCANDCMVQAIHPEGAINPNECLYCLHCQELYFDDHKCPVMIAKRAKRERRAERANPQASEQIQKILDEVKRGKEVRDSDSTGS